MRGLLCQCMSMGFWPILSSANTIKKKSSSWLAYTISTSFRSPLYKSQPVGINWIYKSTEMGSRRPVHWCYFL